MKLQTKLSVAAIVAAIYLVGANRVWSQEDNSSSSESHSSDAQSTNDQASEKSVELQELIEQQVAAAQDVAEAAAAQAAATVDQAAAQAEHAATFNFKVAPNFPPGFPFARSSNEIVKAAEKVRDAADDTTKAAATKELTELIDKYFENDMEQREKELAMVAERVERLKSQLERRRRKKDEIIDLQVKVAINDADGLGMSPPGGFNVGPTAWMGPSPTKIEVPIAMPAPIAKPAKPAKPPVPIDPLRP